MMSLDDQKKLIAEAIARFPATFGLRGWPGDTFRLSESASYFGGPKNETMMLYTERLRPNGEWWDFSKGTESELQSHIVKAP